MLQVLNRAIHIRAEMGVLAIKQHMDTVAIAKTNTQGEHAVSSIMYWAYVCGNYHINCAN